jgi:RNA polymerase sigma-70 factor (ECF subfamily)
MPAEQQRRATNSGAEQRSGNGGPIPSDRDLVDRSRVGDRDAFDLLVRRYEKQVFNTAYRLSGSHDDAADIAQEAFVRAWNNLKSFRGDAAFSTWVFRIVTNVFLDERKRVRSRREHRSLDEALSLRNGDSGGAGDASMARQFEDRSPSPQDRVEQQERQVLLERAIADLPEAQRVMVVLYHTQNRSYEEIAAIMNLPMGTVKSRLNRARLALKSRLLPIAELFGAARSPNT